MKPKVLHSFSSRPPAEMLQEILYFKKRREKGEPIELPLITVMFFNKSAMSGFLVDFRKEETGSSHLIMELAGSTDIFFAETTRVEGLVIHDVEKIDYLLTDIPAEQIAFKKQVTRYEVKRRMAEESERLSSFFEKPIRLLMKDEVLEQHECFYLKNLVTDISITLLTLAEEEEYKAVIMESIREVIVRPGQLLRVNVEDGRLCVADTLVHSYTTNPQRTQLRQAIAEVL